MNELIDIHSHILPAVDDGSESSQMSLEMLRIAWDEGIRKIILTPHNKPMRHNVSCETMKKMMQELLEIARHQGMKFDFFTGNEIYYSSEAVSRLEEKKACTLAGSEYVLMEFGPMDDYDYIRNGIYQVMAGGYHPVLAHAERYKNVCIKAERARELVEMGCYIQLNAGSIMGQYGYGTKQFCKKLLKQQLVHFVATDAHNTGKRGPYLAECKRYLMKKTGEAYTKRILYENPMCIIRNEYL